MTDPTTLRSQMVDRLIERGFVHPGRVEAAMRAVPRHLFVPGVALETAYSGEAIATHRDADGRPTSSCSEAGIVAVMLEQLDPRPGDRVLEIGAGTGYNAALLAWLAGETGAVTTIDLDEEVVREARAHLAATGYERVRVVAGDGWPGAPVEAPFDRIEVTVGLWDLSPHWIEQLREGGLIVVPLWLAEGIQVSVALRREASRLRSVSVRPCGFMRLRGPHAGPEGYVGVDDRWHASMDDPRPEAVAVLRELMRTEPHVERLPPLPPDCPSLPSGWFTRVALEEPDAITLFDHPNRWAAGLFDPASRSLALIEGDRLLIRGSDATAARLRERVSRARPLRLDALTVEAVPSGAFVDVPTGWVLCRPSFTFVVREGAEAGQGSERP